ncbi:MULTISPECIES: CHAT domain-containing protein [unclassified Microbispora]|uniref:CHAT domain-containing protein n=1 Tax=unclassified Microbispora TaxID=2614687 RepID=UPI001F0F16C5|nr:MULTISPECIES: CHAT domain-containing protein [unclassified Microbispora]
MVGFRHLFRMQKRLQNLEVQRVAALGRNDWKEFESSAAGLEELIRDPGFKAMPVRQLIGGLNVIAESRRILFVVHGRADDLDKAITLWREALDISMKMRRTDYQANFHNNLGLALDTLFGVTGERRFFEESVRHAERAVEITSPGSPDMPRHASTLALRYQTRYRLTGDLADIEESVKLLESALRQERKREGSAKIRHNLSMCLMDRFRHSEDPLDLERSYDLIEQALRDTERNDPEYVDTLNVFAGRLETLASVTGDRALLERALAHYREVIEWFAGNPGKRLGVERNLATCLMATYHLTGDAGQLQDALSLMKEVVAGTGEEHPKYSGRCADLGRIHYERHLVTADEGDWLEAVRAFGNSCRTGLIADPAMALQAGRGWGDAALAKERWAEADVAYDYAVKAVDALWRAQISPSYRESWLARAVGLHARSAYAAARAGDLRKAAARLEHGRAFALSEKMALVDVELDRLETLGHGELRHRFLIARNRLFGAADSDAGHLRELRDELMDVAAQIADVDGFQDFLQPPTFEGTIAPIARADPGRVLVYLGATHVGGLAVIIAADGEPFVIWLDSLTEEQVEGVYRDFSRANGRRLVDRAGWDDTLETVASRLGAMVMGPVVKALTTMAGHWERAPEVMLVPQGLLSSLPLHAALVEDREGPAQGVGGGHTGHVLDHVSGFSYAPNARSLRRAEWSEPPSATALAAYNTCDGLTFSLAEAHHVAQRLPEHCTVAADPGRTEVLTRLRSDRVVHLAVHGRSDPYRPVDSHLLLATGPLSLKEILEADGSTRCELAVLSACETGVPGERLPDEAVSLAVGLLHIGVSGVVSSQWAVSDSAALLLMAKLYELFTVAELPMAQALRRAQIWLRDASCDDLATLLDEIGARLPTAEAAAFREAAREVRWNWSDNRPYNGLRHWAAFTFTGIHGTREHACE